MKNHLIIMLKEPRAGPVKTRFGKDIGMVDSAWWLRHQTRRILRVLRDLKWTITLVVSPDKAAFAKHTWPSHYARVLKGRGDLRQRMRWLFLNAPNGAVCMIEW